ncbi:MAG: EAL domain-containing protein [Pseudomonadota bacterium]
MLTFRSKLLVCFVTCMCLPATFGLFVFQYISERKNLETDQQTIEQGSLTLQTTVQNARDFFNFGQRDIAFFATGASRYLVAESQGKRDTRMLLATVDLSGETALKAQQFLQTQTEHERQMRVVVDRLRERGFEDYGVVGEMRQIVHDLEASVVEPELMVHLLSLRRHEKDYIIRNQARYIEKLLRRATLFKESIRVSVPSPRSDELITLVERYVEAFSSLVEMDANIGVRSGGGLFADLKSTENALFRQYEAIHTTYVEEAVARGEALTQRLFIATAVMVLVAITLSVYLSKSLTRPLRILSGRIRQFVRSDFTRNVNVEAIVSDDEVGQIANDFRVLQTAMQDHVASLQAQTEAAELAHAELSEKRQYLATAQRMARMGYWRWDGDRDVLQASEELPTILGRVPIVDQDPISQFSSVIHDEDRDRWEADVRQCIVSGGSAEGDFRLRSEEGSDAEIWVRQFINRENSSNVIIATLQDISDRRNAEAQIREMAYYDILTGLGTRANLNRRLNEMIRSAARRDEGFAVFFMDLDKFKEINDTLGHDSGDELLVQISRRLEETMRDNDFIARLGGDEFCILVENVSDEVRISDIAQRCIEHIEQPLTIAEKNLTPQCSIGIARFPVDGKNPESLLLAGDHAMYVAKKANFHSYEFHNSSMSIEAHERVLLAQELRIAVREKQFELHYQPQVHLATGQIFAWEALIRWIHPERGMIPPNDFIPEIERLGLVKEVGEWVIQESCRQIVEWEEQGLPDVRVCVNIAPRHMNDPRLAETVKDAIYESGILPSQMEIEVTETGIQSSSVGKEVLESIRMFGVEVAIDDFGTGYSSLGSLKHLPVDCLKIDRCFVKDVVGNPEDDILLETIMDLGKSFKFRIVAEGVEEINQIRILQAQDCDLVQGYFFSKPVPADQVITVAQRDFAAMYLSDSMEQDTRAAAG